MLDAWCTQTSFVRVGHQRFEILQPHRHAVAVQRPVAQDDAELLELLPGADIEFVIGMADDDLVARFELPPHRRGQCAHQLRCRRTEDDLLGTLRIHQHLRRLAPQPAAPRPRPATRHRSRRSGRSARSGIRRSCRPRPSRSGCRRHCRNTPSRISDRETGPAQSPDQSHRSYLVQSSSRVSGSARR